MLPQARVRGVTVSVPHIYRDSKAIADTLGGAVDAGGWYPGTGVAFRTVELVGGSLTVVSVVDYHQSRDHAWGRAVYEASRPGTALLSVELSVDVTALPQPVDEAWVPQRRRLDGSYDASRRVLRAAAPDHWLTFDVVPDGDAQAATVIDVGVVADVDVVDDGSWGASPRVGLQTPTGSIEFFGTPR